MRRGGPLTAIEGRHTARVELAAVGTADRLEESMRLAPMLRAGELAAIRLDADGRGATIVRGRMAAARWAELVADLRGRLGEADARGKSGTGHAGDRTVAGSDDTPRPRPGMVAP